MVRRKYIIGVVAFSLVAFTIIILGIYWNIDLDNDNNEVEKEYTVTTKIIDEDDIYEVRLKYFEVKSKVYKNDKVWLDIGETDDVGDYIEFDLNNKSKAKVDINKYKTSVNGVYKIDMDKSKDYVQSLINSNYKLKREVMTENSVDIYLENKDKKITRIIVLSDRLIQLEYEGKSLPDIESYFEER